MDYDNKKQDYRTMNTTALAFLGDAVYEVYIRKHVMKKGIVDADALHREAVRYVRAEAQATAIREIMKSDDILSENELKLVKRARNKKSCSKSRSAGPVDYKLATAFEALLGGLYVNDEKERAEEIILIAIDILEKGWSHE